MRGAWSRSEQLLAPRKSRRQRSSRASSMATAPEQSQPSSDRSVRLGQAAMASLTALSSIGAPTTSSTRSRSIRPHAGAAISDTPQSLSSSRLAARLMQPRWPPSGAAFSAAASIRSSSTRSVALRAASQAGRRAMEKGQ
uniref:Uncharacterized protein n=1 Tax=Arundo donax TaxID=35708 RepID=A0A0A9G467_ARUDO